MRRHSPHRQKRPECLRILAFNKSDFDLGEHIGGKNMENLNFDKEITALSRHRSVQRFHFRGGSRSCQIARKILCKRIRKVTAQREFATVNIKVPSFVHNPAAETSDCYSQSGNCKRQLASIRVCLSVAFACAYFALGSSVQITIRMFCDCGFLWTPSLSMRVFPQHF